MQIAKSAEWRAAVQELRRHLQEEMLQSVLLAARSGKDVSQAIGQHDGYQMAIEHLEAIGRGDV